MVLHRCVACFQSCLLGFESEEVFVAATYKTTLLNSVSIRVIIDFILWLCVWSFMSSEHRNMTVVGWFLALL